MKVVYIKWIDSAHSASGWINKVEGVDFALENNPPSQTVGFLIREDKESVTLLQSIGKWQVDNCIKILKFSIVDRKNLGKIKIKPKWVVRK